MEFFITGTDTAVGKTRFTALYVSALRKVGVNAVGLKPVCCGDRGDAMVLHEASGRIVTMDALNPLWLRPAAAPYVASMIEERPIDLQSLEDSYHRLHKGGHTVVVEGAGGWLVPWTRDYTAADFVRATGLKIIVVVHNRLGAINHTLLTLESIRGAGLTCAGLVINEYGEQENTAFSTNVSILEELCNVPILFHIHEGQSSLDLVLA